VTRRVQLPSEDAARFFIGLAATARAIRAREQLTQREVAARAGLSKRLVSDIENERANPRIIHLDKLARGLGLNGVEELLTLADDTARRLAISIVPPAS